MTTKEQSSDEVLVRVF